MGKIKDFVHTFLDNKTLKPIKLKKGEKVEFYKNKYTVVSCDDKYTILKDAKGSPIAYKTNKMQELMQKSMLVKASGVKGTFTCPSGKVPVESMTASGKKQKYCVDPQTGAKADDQGKAVKNDLSADAKTQLQNIKNTIASKIQGEANQKALTKQAEYVFERKIRLQNLMKLQNEAGLFNDAAVTRVSNIAKNVNKEYDQLLTNLQNAPKVRSEQ